MINHRYLFKRVVAAVLLSILLPYAVAVNSAGADSMSSTNSADQALDQLRILQKRLGGPSNFNATPSLSQEAVKSPSSALESTVPPTKKIVRKIAKPQITSPAASHESPAEEAAVRDLSSDTLIQQAAFEGVEQQMFPLSPEQLVELKKQYKNQQFAKESPVGTPPKPTATSQFVNLSPGSTPPVIRLSQGFVSSLVFLDSTGAPWPISAYDLGDPESFNIQWDKSSNTLMIQAKSMYTYGNLAVRLKELNTPVMLTLIPGQKAVDYRVDMRVQGYGPNAKNLPLEEGLPPSANDLLLHVLDGVPPAGSSRLTVSGGDARAWILGDHMFVRTNLTILSPGWLSSMTSADGMHAYEMQKTPVLLVSWHGKVMQLKVEGL
jgi:intracellular multiplication protein IcmK